MAEPVMRDNDFMILVLLQNLGASEEEAARHEGVEELLVCLAAGETPDLERDRKDVEAVAGTVQQMQIAAGRDHGTADTTGFRLPRRVHDTPDRGQGGIELRRAGQRRVGTTFVRTCKYRCLPYLT